MFVVRHGTALLFLCASSAVVTSGCTGDTTPRGDAGARGDGNPNGPGDDARRGDKTLPDGDAGRDAASCVVFPGESIQECIDDVLAAGGGQVLLRAGRHVVSRYLHVHGSNFSLTGEGAATKLFLANDTHTSVILVGNLEEPNPDEVSGLAPTRNVTLSGFSIDANKQNNVGGPDGNPDDMKGDGDKWAGNYAAHNYIAVSGITIRYAEKVTVRDVVVTNADSAGLLVEKSTKDFSIDGTELRENRHDGFSCNKSYAGSIVNSRFIENTLAGITATCDCADNVFSNNLIAHNGTSGIFFAEAHRNLVEASVMDANGDTGVYLKGADCGVSGGASNNHFSANRITNHPGKCAFYVDAKDPSGGGNVASSTFYSGNGVNGVCSPDPNLCLDSEPMVSGP